jgi:acyl-CoA thioester hydrolase
MLQSPSSSFQHRLDVRVYYEDTDAGGVVFYANYLKFMERGRTEWLRSVGVNQSDVAREFGRIFIVAGLDIKYLKSAKLDDVLQIDSTVTRMGRASLHFAQSVSRNGELLAQSNIQIGCVDTVKMRPAAIPEVVRSKFVVTTQE